MLADCWQHQVDELHVCCYGCLFPDTTDVLSSADFYGASALLPLTDEEIVDRLKSHIQTCEPGFKDANVIDSAVLRFPKAVTHFSPGSYPSRPYQVTGIPNCFLAGDWVKGVSYDPSRGLLAVCQCHRTPCGCLLPACSNWHVGHVYIQVTIQIGRSVCWGTEPVF